LQVLSRRYKKKAGFAKALEENPWPIATARKKFHRTKLAQNGTKRRTFSLENRIASQRR
jgi:hypothetical protein